MAEGNDQSEEPEQRRGSRTRPYAESVAGRSDVDAMGNDKRRQVIGGQYGASVRKRLLIYGAAVAVLVILVVVSLTVIKNVDEKEIPLKDTAPWTADGAQPETPRDVDFNRNGPQDTIPESEIVNR